jgi:pyruvate dehydrogenase E2 component (dihydrolipoamide acetyltransferase)
VNGWPTPTITDVCLRAAALALRQHPAINASFDGDAILYHDTINVGLVIGLPDGMLIPVIRHADRLNLYTLAGTTRRLRQGAESGTLSAADLSGGTFTVSNLGMYGVDSFTAVINPPEAGILALGAVAERPAVINGAVVPRAQMTAVLSIDHRAVDGIVAAQFIATFKSLLENPIALTLDPPQQEAS